MALTQPIRNIKKVKSLLNYYNNRGEARNQVLVTMMLHTALRVSDILKIKCDDVYDFSKGRVRKTFTLSESKTKKNKVVALHKNIIQALKAYISQAKPGAPLILNARSGNAISRIQAYRIIVEAARAIGIDHNVGCHSLRKTFGYLAWTSGAPPVVIMEIYNHSSFAITKRYLGINQDDQNAVYLGINL